MSNINYRLWQRIPEDLRGVMDYYPEVFLYEFNQIQYNRKWQELSAAPYLYCKGSDLRPVSWWTYALQSVKGWLGFSNHCQPEKIHYNLNKLAYYGYTQGLNQPNFARMQVTHQPSKEFATLASQQRHPQTTAQLQHELIKAYFKLEPQLHLDFQQKLNPHHRFGDSWLQIQALDLIPKLDPQDQSLIREVIEAVDKGGIAANSIEILNNSSYAQAAAHYYYDKAKKTLAPSFLSRLIWQDPRPAYLGHALAYHAPIANEDPPIFIEYYLEKKDYQKAIQLINLLTDKQVALKYLILIPANLRDALLSQDSPLAIILAQHYLEKKQYAAAQKLCSNIAALNPVAAFLIALQEQQYSQAYNLVKTHEKQNFPAENLGELAEIFYDAAETEYKKGHALREQKNWSEAESHYFRSLAQKRAAHHLFPTAEYLEQVQVHQRLYAQLLVDRELELNSVQNCEIAKLLTALRLLRECQPQNPKEQQLRQTIFAKALMRHIDYLREKIAFPYSQDSSLVLAHKETHRADLSLLITALKELIDLLQGSKDKNLLPLLAKAYYLHADVHDFFTINDPHINQHYRKAMETAPDNPFYILRAAELFGEEEREQLQIRGVPKLKSLGFTTYDFFHWSEESWVKTDKIIYPIKDIHNIAVNDIEKPSWRFGL